MFLTWELYTMSWNAFNDNPRPIPVSKITARNYLLFTALGVAASSWLAAEIYKPQTEDLETLCQRLGINPAEAIEILNMSAAELGFDEMDEHDLFAICGEFGMEAPLKGPPLHSDQTTDPDGYDNQENSEDSF